MGRRHLMILVMAFTALPAAGCASDPDPQKEQMNEAWREGYGFNNPNVDRIKKGQKPLNFDGSE